MRQFPPCLLHLRSPPNRLYVASIGKLPKIRPLALAQITVAAAARGGKRKAVGRSKIIGKISRLLDGKHCLFRRSVFAVPVTTGGIVVVVPYTYLRPDLHHEKSPDVRVPSQAAKTLTAKEEPWSFPDRRVSEGLPMTAIVFNCASPHLSERDPSQVPDHRCFWFDSTHIRSIAAAVGRGKLACALRRAIFACLKSTAWMFLYCGSGKAFNVTRMALWFRFRPLLIRNDGINPRKSLLRRVLFHWIAK